MTTLQCGRFQLDLSKPKIMAIVNLTDDSFSGDGASNNLAAALHRAEQQLEAGADMLDLGAESTRPGSAAATEEVECERLLPVIEQLKSWNVPLSIDTQKPGVMRATLAAGADMINDINGFRAPGAIDAVAASSSGLCVMHMQGEPATMQQQPDYADVVAEVDGLLRRQVAALENAGVARARIVLDPGFGFGKTVAHNFFLLRHLAVFGKTGLPVLAGLSRKSMLGAVTGRPVGERLASSVAAALIAVENGAGIVRVHDVAATKDALQIWEATYG